MTDADPASIPKPISTRPRRSDRGRSAVRRADRESRAAAAAAAARRLCRTCRDIVVSQQLSTASAGAIWGRLAAAFDPFEPAAIIRARAGAAGAARPVGAENPRAQGNRPRRRRAASLRWRRSAILPADDAHAALTAVHGIGPWTADIYLLSCLGHADAWPAGDLALQEAARLAFGLARAADAQRKWCRSPSRGGRGAPWRRACCGPIIAPSKAREGAPVLPKKSAKRRKGRGRWPLNSTVRGSRRVRGAARQLVVFLHGYGADGNDLIEIGRAWQQYLPQAAFVSPHAPEPCGQAPVGRQWFPLTLRDPNERWVGVNKAAPVLERFLDAELDAPQAAAVRAGAGRLQPGHHDGAACRACAARAAPAAIVGYSGILVLPPDGDAEAFAGRDQVAAAGAAGPRRPRRPDPAAGAVPGGPGPGRARQCRSNGICRPASATASTTKACATAASSWPAASR